MVMLMLVKLTNIISLPCLGLANQIQEVSYFYEFFLTTIARHQF